MTTLTDTQVITASGGLVELGYSEITSPVSVGTSTTNVTSTLTVVCDGSPVLVEFFSPSAFPPVSTGANMLVYLHVDGSQDQGRFGTLLAAASGSNQIAPCYMSRRLTPSAGSHTFQVKATASVASGGFDFGSGAGTHGPGYLRVSKIVQATQWPAVTTGTIICTSSTRPASPFEGQVIYETDTDKLLVYNGTGWYPPWNMPWGVVMNVTSSSTQALTVSFADVTSLSGTAALVQNRRYRIDMQLALSTATNAYIDFRAVVGSTNLDTWISGPTNSTRSQHFRASTVYTHTSADASTTIKGQALYSNAAVSLLSSASFQPHRLTVEDIGPA